MGLLGYVLKGRKLKFGLVGGEEMEWSFLEHDVAVSGFEFNRCGLFMGFYIFDGFGMV